MIKNINDYVTFFFMIAICAYSIRLFVGNLTSHRNDDTPRSKRHQMVKEYTENEEE